MGFAGISRTSVVRFVALAAITVSAASARSAHGQSALARGRDLTAWLLNQETQKLFPLFSADLKLSVKGDSGLAKFSRGIRATMGTVGTAASEDTSVVNGFTTYRRITPFAKTTALIEIRFAWNARGTITGMSVGPAHQAAATPFLDYQTKTALRLPFDGEWFVFWGGRAVKQNYHVEFTDQRFGYDFLVVQNGASHSGEGKTNTDYYCYGKPVVAPGAGNVVAEVDAIAENIPGQMDAAHPFGNHVIIDHGNGEFSVLAHLRRGSVVVKTGQRVKAGDKVGACGNSGDSSEPHVHYHLQNGLAFGRSLGLPAFFTDYIANDARVSRGEPQQGQRIRRP